MTEDRGSNMMRYELTLRAVLERAATWFPQGAIVCGERRSHYAELQRRALALGAGLRGRGVNGGDRVATLLWNEIEHLEAYFGVPLAGGIVHPLNLRLHPEQLAAIIRHAGDRVILVGEALLPLWDEIKRHATVAEVVVVPHEYQRLLEASPLPPVELHEDDGAAMGYTSGTTGEPKGVVYSHRAIVLHALATALPDAMNMRQRDCVMPLVPMFHANAWGIPYTGALLGCKQVLAGAQFEPTAVLDTMEQEQVTFSAGVGVIWQRILDALEREPGRWRLHPELRVNLGGAPASAALFHRFDRQGIAVNMGWGMTEMTPVGAMNPLYAGDAPNQTERRIRQGRPLPLVEARTAAGGELEVRGPWVAGEYFRGDHPQAFTPDGWFRTGDVVEFDGEGLMAIVDRQKDLIRSGGEWISSVALENALGLHPDIRESAVIAVPHPDWQERPLAVVVLNPGAVPSPDHWRQHLEANFPRWQCPDAFVAVQELPRTATGKLDKRALRAQYANWSW